MLIKRPDDIRPSEITDPQVYQARRQFITGAGAIAAGLALGGGYLLGRDSGAADTPAALGAERFRALARGPGWTDEEQTSFESATNYNNFYELGTDKRDPVANADRLITDPWSVDISGECEKPGKIALEDLLKGVALEERVYRLRCVEAWSMVIPWVGFSLSEVLKRFQPTSQAKYVQFFTLHDPKNLPGQQRPILDWPYREGLRMDEAMHPLATLAVGMYGQVLPNQNGAPLRLVLPWKYGFKSLKSIVAIRFVREQPATSWNTLQGSEYGFYANVNPAVSHPRWSQARERRIGEWGKRDTLMFNGYGDQVAGLYKGMDLARLY